VTTQDNMAVKIPSEEKPKKNRRYTGKPPPSIKPTKHLTPPTEHETTARLRAPLSRAGYRTENSAHVHDSCTPNQKTNSAHTHRPSGQARDRHTTWGSSV